MAVGRLLALLYRLTGRQRGGKPPETVDPALAQRVDQLMDEGLCCSETVLEVAVERIEPALDRGQLRLGGLCGGMGNRQATCGVHTGGAVAIATLLDDASPRTVRKLCSEYQQRLAATCSGRIVCGELIEHRDPSLSKSDFCHQITRQGSALAIELIQRQRQRNSGSQ